MKKYKTTIMAFYEAFNYFVSASIIILKVEMDRGINHYSACMFA